MSNSTWTVLLIHYLKVLYVASLNSNVFYNFFVILIISKLDHLFSQYNNYIFSFLNTAMWYLRFFTFSVMEGDFSKNALKMHPCFVDYSFICCIYYKIVAQLCSAHITHKIFSRDNDLFICCTISYSLTLLIYGVILLSKERLQ